MSKSQPESRYFMPPEWMRHTQTLLTWPDNRETWPGERLNRAEHIYADILEALTPHERVLLLVANEEAQQAAAAMIQNRNIDWDRIRLIRMPVNDVWIRDYGPICLIRNRDASDEAASEERVSAGVTSDKSESVENTSALDAPDNGNNAEHSSEKGASAGYSFQKHTSDKRRCESSESCAAEVTGGIFDITSSMPGQTFREPMSKSAGDSGSADKSTPLKETVSTGGSSSANNQEQNSDHQQDKSTQKDRVELPSQKSRTVNNGGEIVMSNWEYNAWGGKYPPFDADNAVPGKLARLLDYPEVPVDMILEGGSIEVNGAGCVMTTESVLLNPNRNPGMTKSDIEQWLMHFLGVEKVIWLKNGLRGDDTDGHIDDLARFIAPRTIVTSVSDDPEDPNYAILQENLRILRDATDTEGRPFEIIALPLPMTRIEGTTVDGSEYVPASYANFYIANGIVLVPLYDSRFDEMVLKLFQSFFPDRQVKGILCQDLVWGQGSIHCITQQVL